MSVLQRRRGEKNKEATRNGVREGPKSITNLLRIQHLFFFF